MLQLTRDILWRISAKWSRVENLERFTTLSLLESEVNSLKVIDDETGVDKFKTGFIVDDLMMKHHKYCYI